MSKIVVLLGSPRKNGNTEKLVEAFTKGAESAGHQVTRFSVAQTRVNGCLGCDYCMSHGGECVQKDGMQAIYEALYQADTLVFATPVYYFGMTAQIKAIIDRFYASGEKPFPITSSALLVALGGDPETDGAATQATYKTIAQYMQWQDKGVVMAGSVMDRDDILGHSALQQAQDLGRSL